MVFAAEKSAPEDQRPCSTQKDVERKRFRADGDDAVLADDAVLLAAADKVRRRGEEAGACYG